MRHRNIELDQERVILRRALGEHQMALKDVVGLRAKDSETINALTRMLETAKK